jgi:methylglutaconyl-CoA hydratase
MTSDRYLLTTDARGVATLTLNRPEVANAYDEDLLRSLTAALEKLGNDADVRALVIRGAGKHFQAGADLNWLNRLSRQGPEENYVASIITVRFSKALNELPKPTIAVVHGACFGGGCGIACCVDIALATPDAIFGISEVRHGIAPTPISTHMVNAIGIRQARRYALTGERFDADEALRMGMVHEVVPTVQMEARLAEVLDAILLSAPGAIARTKRSMLGANGLVLDEREAELLAHEGWMQRQSTEGQEGTTAFREKRKPIRVKLSLRAQRSNLVVRRHTDRDCRVALLLAMTLQFLVPLG